MTDDAASLELVVGFCGEAEELCERITLDLLALERADSAKASATFARIAQTLHTLKGSSATIGLGDVADLTHTLEDDLARHMRDESGMGRDAIDAWLAALDAILTDVRLRARGRGESAVAALARAAEALGGSSPSGGRPDVSDETGVVADPTLGASHPKAPAEARDDVMRIASGQLAQLIEDVERVRALRMKIDGRRRAIEREILKPQASRSDADAWTMLSSLALALKSDGAEAADAVSALEDGLRMISTLPVRTITDVLQRAVRDLCRAAGKEAALSTIGSDVSIDRRVLDAIRGPLQQLVRNAVAHGVETPDVRIARGKHREAVIELRFELVGSFITLEVGDDGEGLDRTKIRERAIARGFIERDSEPDVSTLDELIFHPGFSTRDSVDGDSGRGMGMSIVRSEVDALGGRVDVRSVAGQGTRFILTIPVELGGSPVLVVRCGEDVFGVPLLDVEAGVAFRADSVRGGAGFIHRDQLLQLDDLGAVLGIREAVPPTRGQPLLVLRARDQRRVLAVDEVIGEEDVVIRPLPPELRFLTGYRGAATLALGELLLVLDAGFLVQGRTQRSEGHARPRVLVVDDSITARAMYRTILESRGYVVHAAASLAQANEQLRHGVYAAVLLDVQLEDGDGLTLARSLRARPDTRRLPILVVSSGDAAEDVRRAIEAGADVYLRKNECAEGRLLAEVESLLEERRSA